MENAEKNTIELRELFQVETEERKLRGILGITSFNKVHSGLLDVQKDVLKGIVGDRFDELMEKGSIISFAYVYPDGITDNIAVLKDGVYDKETWNIYADWYTYLNNSLDASSTRIADEFNGIPISATTSGIAATISHVSQYYPIVVSHRVHAENAGIGWRGKNSLIINPHYSCMIRLSGVITDKSLIHTPKQEEDCGGCTSCEEACTFIKYRDILPDYRDQCLRYMVYMGLRAEVCGKCVKACVNSPRLENKSMINKKHPLDQIYYTSP